jgi:hypothetical protein
MLALALLGCHHPDDSAPAGDGVFASGCPTAGHATAAILDDGGLDGPDALGGPGDAVLYSSRAAFVISDPANPKTYYSYGGIPIDAVAVDGCDQAVPERFGEMGFVLGQLELTDFSSSQLRMFRGDSIEVVNDGSDGNPAIVDVHGTDDRFWLIELELIRRTLQSGGRKYLHDPWGLDVTLRYTLDPDSAVLRADLTIASDVPDAFLVGSVLFPSDHADELAGRTGQLDFGGVNLDTGVPWFVSAAADGTGSTAVAMPGAAMARTKIAGVTAMIDARQAVEPLEVGPGVTATGSFAIAAGAGDANTATVPLCDVLPEPIPGATCNPARTAGTVRDPAGDPVPDALVDILTSDADGNWYAFDRTRTDASGEFTADAVAIGPLKLQAHQDGRDPSELGDPGSDLVIGASGALIADIRDGDGNSIPARLIATRGSDRRVIDVLPGESTTPLSPGTWSIAISRGYEYEPTTASVTIPAGGSAPVDAVLEHLVDTTGWMSFDGHVHTEASPDSRVLREERARNAGAVGLEVIVDSDHEVVSDETPGIDDAGLGEFVATVVGEEVTATSPEHTQAWPFVPDGTPRGGPVRWYGLSLGQIFAAERDRGAGVVVLNHPRIGCNYLCLIDWDRLTGEARFDDPAAVGVPADQPLFDWNFDAVEVMNGPRDVLLHDDDPLRTGFLDDWLAMIDLGHPITGLGVSDSHDPEDLAWPRTYFASPTDEPSEFDDAMLVDAVLAGKAQISAGAFARVSANGAGIGELASGAAVELAVRVDAVPSIDITHAVVLVNCDQVADLDADDPHGVVKLDTTLPLHLDADASIVILGFGAEPMPAGLPDYDPSGVPRVITNPIYVDADGNGRFDAPGGKTCDYVHP